MNGKVRECWMCAEPEHGYLNGEHWRAILDLSQHLLGKTLIATRRHVEDVAALTDVEWAELHDLLRRVQNALLQVFAPDHWNYAFLMNVDRHVHLHVTPRYRSERTFGGLTFTDPYFGRPIDVYAPELRGGRRLPAEVQAELRHHLQQRAENIGP